jgi:hypothetical protein
MDHNDKHQQQEEESYTATAIWAGAALAAVAGVAVYAGMQG